jgi:hypothetical protein
MISTARLQVANLLYCVLRENRNAGEPELTEEKAEDILSFCSVDLLQLCMEQLIREEDYERCSMLRDLIGEKCADQDRCDCWQR